MGKYITITALFFSLYQATSFAQTMCTVQKATAYYMVSIAGNIAVDPNGTPLRSPATTMCTIFIETKKNVSPTWENASVGGRRFAVSPTTESVFPLTVGRIKNSEKSGAIFAPLKGNQITRLEIQMEGDSLRPGKVRLLLEGKCNNRKITYLVSNITELEAPLYP